MSGRKVAFLGNMNNNHYSLSRYLRDEGIDSDVLMFDDDPAHFHPSCDSFDTRFEDHCRQLSWGGLRQFHRTSRAQIREDLSSYDFLIGCGAAPAYCAKVDRALDVFVPYGGDIWALAGKSTGDLVSWAKNATIALPQRRAIGRSRVFHMTATNDLYERQWQRLKGGSQRWYDPFPMVYDREYRPERLQASAGRTLCADEFRKIREDADLMLFSATRHFWKCEPGHPAAKGTDRLFRALALFKARHPHVRVKLATLEYGRDVAASKALATELDINDVVTWLPAMRRKDLMVGLALADVACAEFENSWIASGVLYEALALGRPILAYRDDASYADSTPDLYPIMNAKQAADIAERLHEFWEERKPFEAMGIAAREWYLREVVEKPVQRYVSLIKSGLE